MSISLASLTYQISTITHQISRVCSVTYHRHEIGGGGITGEIAVVLSEKTVQFLLMIMLGKGFKITYKKVW